MRKNLLFLLSLAVLATAFAVASSATLNAYAMQLNFDVDTGNSYQLKQAGDFSLPLAIISTVAIIGLFLIISERKKAKGIWFSNGEKYR